MKNRKLGIFVSSTYRDLIEERNAVSKAILASGNIPMGMELFTPNGKPTMDVIRAAIDNSDYLLLIIGGKYGSIYEPEKKSYTEMEYEYAVKNGKPVLLFYCEDVEALPVKKVETIQKKRQMLNKFRTKVQNAVLGMGWSSISDLELKVSQALSRLNDEANESLGWIRVKDANISPENTSTIFVFTQEKRPENTKFTVLAQDAQEIIIFLKTGVTLFSSYEKQLIEEIDKGCKLVFITPDVKYVSAIAGQKDMDIYHINFEKVKNHIQRLRSKVINPDNIITKFIEYVPTMGILYFKKNDGTEVMLIQEYFISACMGRDRPMFKLTRDDLWYDAYYDELMSLLNEGREIVL